MTHILTNPGFPRDLRYRSKSADVFRAHQRRKEGISTGEFDKIRSLSRQSWNREWTNPGNPLPSVRSNHYVTTYSATHNYKTLQEPTQCRATSPTRRNNPHPTRAFLRLRLRQAHGFPKPKLNPGQDPYRDYCDKMEEEDRPQQTMYYSLWETKDLAKRGVDETLKAVMDPSTIQATKAWMKNASDKDKKIVTDMLESTHEETAMEKSVTSTFKPDVIPAVNRWLKQAGREEQQAVMRLIRTLESDPLKDGTINPRYTGQQNPDRYILGRYTVRQPATTELHTKVETHFPRKSHFKAHPAWLQA